MESKSSSTAEEHFPYDSIYENFQFRTVADDGVQFSVTTEQPPAGEEENVDPDLALAAYVLQHALRLGSDLQARVLHLGCTGYSLAGIAALKLGFRDVAFVGRSSDTMRRTTWRNLYLNCPEGMAMARCFSLPEGGLSAMAAAPREANGAGPYDAVLLALDDLTPALWQELLAALEVHLSAGGVALVAARHTSFLQAVVPAGGRRLGHTVLQRGAEITILQVSARQQE